MIGDDRDAVKENVRRSLETFAGKFDRLMQQMDYNEANGIIIGPEFSRIFAELILQSVDRALCSELQSKAEGTSRPVEITGMRVGFGKCIYVGASAGNGRRQKAWKV